MNRWRRLLCRLGLHRHEPTNYKGGREIMWPATPAGYVQVRRTLPTECVFCGHSGTYAYEFWEKMP